MSNDPAAPDESAGQLPSPADPAHDAPATPAADVQRALLDATAPPPLAPEALAERDAPQLTGVAVPRGSDTMAESPALERPVARENHAPPALEAAAVAEAAAGAELATSPSSPAVSEVAPAEMDVWPPPEPIDPYVDVPASLELAYTPADIGLTDAAYERSYPYEVIQKKRRRTAGTRARKVGRELAETVILALLIFFSVKALVQNFRVEGQSMEPSMHNNQYLLVNKALYFRADLSRLHDLLPFIPGGDDSEHHLFRAPRRGDVIVFKFPLDPSRDFIKRVIGVPGDTVEVHDEAVFINGSPLKEDYIKDTPNYTYGPKTVPPGMYFVLGDNRRNSLDSHAWGNSCSPQQVCDFVPEENIIGQAWVTYWPFDQLGFINNKIIKPQAP
jgi:signal peptidase I